MKFFKWTVEIEVAEAWVEDGFDLTEERLKDMVEADLMYSYHNECKVKILEAPDPKEIRKVQGYED